jgi:hypothetical protein
MADSNIALTTFTTGAMTVAALNWVKASPWFPWITKEKTTLLRLLSAVAATASGVGISHVWNSADHSLIISGITTTNVALFFWAILKQFAMNETLYQTTKRTSDPKVVQVAKEVENVLPPGVKVQGDDAKP